LAFLPTDRSSCGAFIAVSIQEKAVFVKKNETN